MEEHKTEILNCGRSGEVSFHVTCEVGWDEMEPTASPHQRLCQLCRRRVYRCFNAVDAGLRAEQGECIAVPAWLAQGARQEKPSCLIVGRPERRVRFQELVEQRIAEQSAAPGPDREP